MGFDDLDLDLPSSGGRPKEKSDEPREVEADRPHTMNKCSEEWWQSIYNDIVGDDDVESDHITELSRTTALRPDTVRYFLQKYDIQDFNLGGNYGNVTTDVKNEDNSGGVGSFTPDNSSKDQRNDKLSSLKDALNNV